VKVPRAVEAIMQGDGSTSRTMVEPQAEVDPSGSLLLYWRPRRERPTVEDRRVDENDVEPLPDLGTLSDEELKALIERLSAEEDRVSYRRRLLQGRIDILRAERTARLKGTGGGNVDVDRLTDILAARATPPAQAEDA